MYHAALARYSEVDLVVAAAAVADWRPAEFKPEKEPKVGEEKVLRLVRTPDILAEMGRRKAHQVLIGFAMETERGLERAYEKLRAKNLDLIALNHPTEPDTAFGSDYNRLVVIEPSGRSEAWPRLPKLKLAHRLLDRARRLMRSSV